jgi:hypothetical protein
MKSGVELSIDPTRRTVSIEDLRKDAAAAGEQAELLFQAAERSASKFMFFARAAARSLYPRLH